MTGDGRMRAELEALEDSAPADLPPRPSRYRRHAWLRLAAPAAVMVLAGVVIGIGLQPWLHGLRLSASPSPTTSTVSLEPSSSERPAAVEIQCNEVDETVCAQVADAALSSVVGQSGLSIAVGSDGHNYYCDDCFSTPRWLYPFQATFRFSDARRPLDLDCAIEEEGVTCSPAVAPPATTPQIGVAYPVTIYTHCGLPPIEFDGNRWVIEAAPTDDGGNAPDGFGRLTDKGTLTLISENEGIYRSEEGVQRRVTRGGGIPIWACF